jgi:hypothetical protein
VGFVRPPVQWVRAAVSSEVRGPGREACHFRSSEEVKNEMSCNVLLVCAFVECEGMNLLSFTRRKY